MAVKLALNVSLIKAVEALSKLKIKGFFLGKT